MLFRHHTDTTITPDTLFEAKGPFEDSRIFKILENSGIIYRKSVMKITGFSIGISTVSR